MKKTVQHLLREWTPSPEGYRIHKYHVVKATKGIDLEVDKSGMVKRAFGSHGRLDLLENKNAKMVADFLFTLGFEEEE